MATQLSPARRKTPRSTVTDKELATLWRRFMRSKPLIGPDLYKWIEHTASEGVGFMRRVTLRTAEFGGKHHYDAAMRGHEDAVAIATAMLCAKRWGEHLDVMRDIATAQATRLEMALCDLENKDALIAEAEADFVKPGAEG